MPTSRGNSARAQGFFVSTMRPNHITFILIAVVLFGAGFAYVKTPPPQATEIVSETAIKVDQKVLQKEDNDHTKIVVTETISAQFSDQIFSIESPVPEPPTKYTIPVLSDTTVIAAMNAYATVANFSFSGRDFPGLGLFVEEIDGRKNGGGFYWTLFINNELSEKGASQMEVSPSDTVEWRYQKSV